MWIATGDIGADLSKTISKKSLEIVLEAEILAALGVLNFRKDKTPKALDFTGFQRFLPSDIFDYFALMSDFGESLENRLPSRAREFAFKAKADGSLLTNGCRRILAAGKYPTPSASGKLPLPQFGGGGTPNFILRE